MVADPWVLGVGCVPSQPAVQMYDVENPRKASTAVANPDGSVYGDHKLIDLEWDIVRDSSFVLYFPYVVVQRLQATHTPTSNLVMPFVSFLACKLHDDIPLVISGVRREHIDQHVAAARRNLYKDVSKRYFNDLMECKLEDLAVATGLVPRYKSFNFKFVDKWNRDALFNAYRMYLDILCPCLGDDTLCVP
ncbi:hypothetical protein CYMTET_49459 [Cymbomonas tetramitiformis]|uniref:Uncharacterized protein n=1 Tax=Cymbomonas tetramitiformis TaxID=36881 RepID=A0AAE0BQ85_9CHLO|nr:hypothetical protein CYMTET_49459 [Cymbomonas tetramitiformis]